MLVDGYNVIFAWEDLKELAKTTIDGAREKLLNILCNYQGYKKCEVIVVFDAYKVKGGVGEVDKLNNINIVYMLTTAYVLLVNLMFPYRHGNSTVDCR